MRGLVLAVMLAAPMASAQPITIEAADGFRLVRCIDLFGSAACEFLSASQATFLTCVALDEAGEPLAVASAMTRSGSVNFPALAVDTVAEVVCRE